MGFTLVKVSNMSGAANGHVRDLETTADECALRCNCTRLEQLKTHLSHDERTWLTRHIRQKFIQSLSLKTHVRRHEGVKPYVCFVWSCSVCVEQLREWVSRGLTSHSTLYRSFLGRFLQTRWPNQHWRKPVGHWDRLRSHQNHSTVLQYELV